MTSSFEDPIITITPRLTTELPATAGIAIPASQRRAGDTIRDLALPAGMHQIQIDWRGPLPLAIYVQTGTNPVRTISNRLPGGADAQMIMIPIVIGEGGGKLWFQPTRRATTEEISMPGSTMGLSVFLNPARAAS